MRVFVFVFVYGGVQATQGIYSTIIMTDLAKGKYTAGTEASKTAAHFRHWRIKAERMPTCDTQACVMSCNLR